MAGMGDVVFAPLYTVLQRRGVKFEFFHAVRRLRLDPDDPGAVGAIEIDRQARLTSGTYEPLYDVDGLPCWPSEPLYEQIEGGAALEEGWTRDNLNLESWWSRSVPVEQRTLVRGKDFDRVVLGISIAALPSICEELIERSPAWKRMVDEIKTVPTQALQLWFRPDLRGLGWEGPSVVIDAYVPPFSTWADMSHLLPRERWSQSPDRPATLAYLCGRAPEPSPLPGPEAHGFAAEQLRRVREDAVRWLGQSVRPLWPLATTTHDPDALNWYMLVDPENRRGEARLDAQYWRVNLDPSERYVLSLKGTTQYRLEPGKSGFDNLFLAGDWTRNGMNHGTVEAAVMSGMQASRAIAGYPEIVIGERDVTLPRSGPSPKQGRGARGASGS
jgi:uncharacterized protein with NAD-binding domain and iron-sulfur cluster